MPAHQTTASPASFRHTPSPSPFPPSSPHRDGRTTAPAVALCVAAPPPTAMGAAAPLSSRVTSSSTSGAPNTMFLLQQEGHGFARTRRGGGGGLEGGCALPGNGATTACTPTAARKTALALTPLQCTSGAPHLKGTADSSRRPVAGSSLKSNPFCRNASMLSLQRSVGSMAGSSAMNVQRHPIGTRQRQAVPAASGISSSTTKGRHHRSSDSSNLPAAAAAALTAQSAPRWATGPAAVAPAAAGG